MPDPDSRELATPLARGVALVLDLVFVQLLYVCFFVFIAVRLWGGVFPDSAVLFIRVSAGLLWFFLSFPLFVFAYFFLLHAWQGQTLGKMFLGLRVVSTTGETIGMGQSFLRIVGFALALLPAGFGLLWAFVDPERCGWHDRLACTSVVGVDD